MLSGSIGKLLIVVASFIVGMSGTTQVSISLEGKNLWILKSLPVKMKDIYLSKIMVSLTLIVPSVIIFAIIVGIAFKLALLDYIFIIIIPILFATFLAVLGLVINLHFPKLDAKSDTVIVKQSTSSFLNIMAGMILTFAGSAIYFMISFIGFNIYAIILIIILLIAILLLWRYLNTKGVKLFRKLDT